MSSQLAAGIREPEVRIETDRVPDSLRPALQSEEIQEVAAALMEAIRNDPRNQRMATPVACPGAPYRRRKNTR